MKLPLNFVPDTILIPGTMGIPSIANYTKPDYARAGKFMRGLVTVFVSLQGLFGAVLIFGGLIVPLVVIANISTAGIEGVGIGLIVSMFALIFGWMLILVSAKTGWCIRHFGDVRKPPLKSR